MYYGIYQAIRHSSWQCLLDFHINRLPVDLLKITRTMGVRVIKNSLVDDLLPGENGKAYYDGKQWILLYDDRNPTPLSRYAIAHELGHIFLGHELAHIQYAHAKEFTVRPKSEQHADSFALRLLCPACVLWKLNLSSPEQIAAYCRVPTEAALIRTKRMKELLQRNRFLSDPLEELVFRQFEAYVCEQQNRGSVGLP